jgi:3',5'-cyclic-AMP phosphodiesterase
MIAPLRFIHISDTHINPDPTYIKSYAQYTPMVGAKALVQAVQALPFTPDFILHTGDVAYDPDPAVYPAVQALFSPLSVPIHYLVGNHDDGRDLQRVLLGRAEADIQDFLYYTFEAKGVQVVCLDSNGDHDPERPSGTVTDAQLAWLDTICTADDPRPLVVAIHHNVIPMGVPWLDDWMRLENGAAVHACLTQARHRLRGVFFGHIHQNIETMQDGVLYVAAASSWCQFISYPMPENERVAAAPNDPPGFSIVTVTPERTYLRRHTVPLPA